MEKKYEIRLRYIKKISLVEKVLKSNNIEYTENNNTYILTKGDSIAEFLRVLNLTNFLLRFEEKRIQKEYMNNTNRTINFEIANMEKVIKTASKQLERLNNKYKESNKNRNWNNNINRNENTKEIKKRGIYIHIPFCKQKCGYCDFHSFAKIENLKEEYVKALCNEIKEFAKNISNEDKYIDTIFFRRSELQVC